MRLFQTRSFLDLKAILLKLISDIYVVSAALFKVMIPTIILVKIAEIMGLVSWLTILLAPALKLIGLPAEMALGLTTTILTNPYAGLLVFAATPDIADLSVAQTTIIASFMLFTHNLILEAVISQKAGLRILTTVTLRLCAGFLFCALLHWFFTIFGLFSQAAMLNLPQMAVNPTIVQWCIDQSWGLLFIQLVIILLIVGLEILRRLGIDKLIHRVINPFLLFLKIGEQASTIIVVGFTLGLAYGGGLLVRNVKQGIVPAKSAAGALVLINLFHSVFEDTAVLMLLGPSLLIILCVRAAFVFVFAWVVIGCINRLNDEFFNKLIFNSAIIPKEN
ncbi:nucleoside recognition domain-containing protein [Alphaproteobacteria bacterium]|jgi:hypothetical protein|nr:nucleoside recognition domain-containing protein [Alphaproteobacteria bacterium]MBT5799297.1 nucleoside recognition domain-containing protein [Alphaproteobacteria bacterium]MDA9190757.1 nucleoside recognition domain-containing protein [Alphaproteobacteria bacterium]